MQKTATSVVTIMIGINRHTSPVTLTVRPDPAVVTIPSTGEPATVAWSMDPGSELLDHEYLRVLEDPHPEAKGERPTEALWMRCPFTFPFPIDGPVGEPLEVRTELSPHFYVLPTGRWSWCYTVHLCRANANGSHDLRAALDPWITIEKP